MKGDMGVVWPESKKTVVTKSQKRRRVDSPPQEGLWPTPHPPHAFVLDFWPLELERLSFSHVKPPRLWQFVTAAPRNSYGFREARQLAGHLPRAAQARSKTPGRPMKSQLQYDVCRQKPQAKTYNQRGIHGPLSRDSCDTCGATIAKHLCWECYSVLQPLANGCISQHSRGHAVITKSPELSEL